VSDVFQLSQISQVIEKVSRTYNTVDESTENYLAHPTLGLLYSVCQIEDNVELFTTLYAKSLFFLVRSYATHLKFELMSQQEARLIVEQHLYNLLRLEQAQEYEKVKGMYQQLFG
jgi:PII interaction protein X